MNKGDLAEAIAKRLNQSRREANETVDAVIEEIKEAVAEGEKVVISGFGVFEGNLRSERVGRNPRTGEAVPVAATRVPRFRPGAEFKAMVAGARRAVSRSDAAAEPAPTGEASADPAGETTADPRVG